MSLVDLGKRLLEAAKVGSVDEVRTLMSNGAPFTTDWLGTSPLHFAALNGHVDTADVLLRAGISRDARTKVDRTSLHVASQEGHTSIVELLIRQGADVEAKDMLRMTPLHWAVERGHIEVIETLLANGADIECHNKFEKTCIDIANGNGRQDITQMLLLSRGHQVSIPRSNHVDLDHIGTAVELEEVTEVNEVQPEITIEQEVISAEAAEGDTYVIDTNSTEGDATQGGYYLTDGSGVTVTEESQEESVVEESAGGEDNTDVLATLAAIAEAKAPISLNTTETLKWLETQGITMLDSDNSTLVGNTVDNGQQVILTEAGKLALKQMIQGKKEVGDQSQKLVTYVDGQMVEVSNQDGNEGSMTVTLQSRDYASGEPALKRIKREEEDSNNLIIEQNVEEETYEENYEEQELSEVDEHQLILKPEPE